MADTTESVTMTYKLRERATFNVSYRNETRESNTFRFDTTLPRSASGAT